MARTKVISNLLEVTRMLRALNSDESIKLYRELVEGWISKDDIIDLSGEKGLEILEFLEKENLVENRLVTEFDEDIKYYHTYYENLTFKASFPIIDIIHVFKLLSLPEDKYFEKRPKQFENQIISGKSKSITDIIDLVPAFRSLDTDVKREAYELMTKSWLTQKEAFEEFGEQGVKSISLMEKIGLVETKWVSTDRNTEKSYHEEFKNINVNFSIPMYQAIDVLYSIAIPEEKYSQIETNIYNRADNEGCFSGDIINQYEITNLMLKALIKRSNKIELKGHKITRKEG